MKDQHFVGAILCNVRNDSDVPFWYICWEGNQTLMQAFPELYALVCNDSLSVAVAGAVSGSFWEWNAAAIFHDSNAVPGFLWQDLLGFTQHVTPRDNVMDGYV